MSLMFYLCFFTSYFSSEWQFRFFLTGISEYSLIISSIVSKLFLVTFSVFFLFKILYFSFFLYFSFKMMKHKLESR